jgi:vacuolar-type H+-ATPase subunit I/STV1
MGNLYTQLKRITDPVISILFQLKLEHRHKPKNWSAINKLQKELSRLQSKKNKTQTYQSIFGGGYRV